VILIRSEAIAGLEKLVAVPTTQTIRGIPSEVELGRDDGMPGDCVVSTDNITMVRKALLTRHITTLSDQRMNAVCRALAYATSC
jgi:mRNA interferase MazF